MTVLTSFGTRPDEFDSMNVKPLSCKPSHESFSHPRSVSAPPLRPSGVQTNSRLADHFDNDRIHLERQCHSEKNVMEPYNTRSIDFVQSRIHHMDHNSLPEYFEGKKISYRKLSNSGESGTESDHTRSVENVFGESSEHVDILRLYDDEAGDLTALKGTESELYGVSSSLWKKSHRNADVQSPSLPTRDLSDYQCVDYRDIGYLNQSGVLNSLDHSLLMPASRQQDFRDCEPYRSQTGRCYYQAQLEYMPDLLNYPESFGLRDFETVPAPMYHTGSYGVSSSESQFSYNPKGFYGMNILEPLRGNSFSHDIPQRSPQSVFITGSYQSPVYSPPTFSPYDNYALPLSQYGPPYFLKPEQSGVSPINIPDDFKRTPILRNAESSKKYRDSSFVRPAQSNNIKGHVAFNCDFLKSRAKGTDEQNTSKQEMPSSRSLPNSRHSKKGLSYSSPVVTESAFHHSGSQGPLTLETIRGHIYMMSSDQTGCRQLQQLLVDDSKAAGIIFHEVKEHLGDLMTHPFGNYLFQKLLENLTVEDRTEAITVVSSKLVFSGRSLHGTRSVQKVVQVAQTKPEREQVIAGLSLGVVQLATDSNGNHIIQRVLQYFSLEGDSAFVYETLKVSLKEIATHRYGCCVVQRALDAASYEQRIMLVSLVAKDALDLMQDPFGNYVVQYVLDKCSSNEVESITKVPLGNVCILSSHKFSSNVVEKCLDKASQSVKSLYIQEIISTPNVGLLIQDQYANYVLQRALSVASTVDFALLTEVVRPYLSTLGNSTGGRKISLKIRKRYPEIAPSQGAALSSCINGFSAASNHNATMSSVDDSIMRLNCQFHQLQV